MIHRHGTTKRYSDSTTFNGLVYLVEIPSVDNNDMTAQAMSLLQSLEARLQAAGSSKHHLLQVQVLLTDLRDADAFNRVWEAWLPEGTAPSRACYQISGLVNPNWKVELIVTAAKA